MEHVDIRFTLPDLIHESHEALKDFEFLAPLQIFVSGIIYNLLAATGDPILRERGHQQLHHHLASFKTSHLNRGRPHWKLFGNH